MKKSLLLVLMVVSLIVSGCSQGQQQVENQIVEQKLKVYTSFYPLYYIANQIGGEKIEAKLVIPNGAEVHSYEPSPRKLADLERSDIFFYNGLGLEPWADKVVTNLKNEGVKTVKVSDYIRLLKFEEHGHEVEHGHDEEHSHKAEHSHDEEHNYKHNHGEYDPHIWLNPINMIDIARVMKEEFIALDSDNKELYNQNFTNFTDKIESLDQDYNDILANKKQNYILVSHASFGYLAARYGLEQLAVSGVSPHQEPSPKDLAKLTKEAQEHGIKYIFMETLVNPKTAQVLAQEADLEVLTLNPIAGLTKEEQDKGEDYISIMKQNLSSLRKALVD
jgi:zinc transport system substrate-binding protein